MMSVIPVYMSKAVRPADPGLADQAQTSQQENVYFSIIRELVEHENYMQCSTCLVI